PVVATVHQQIPLHPLAAIAIGFDTCGRQVGVEQKGQRQRKNLGFAGAIVSTEQQMAVAKPEFLDVVVEHLDQPDSQRLPSRSRRSGQWNCRGRGYQVCASLRVYRWSAANGRTLNPIGPDPTGTDPSGPD